MQICRKVTVSKWLHRCHAIIFMKKKLQEKFILLSMMLWSPIVVRTSFSLDCLTRPLRVHETSQCQCMNNLTFPTNNSNWSSWIFYSKIPWYYPFIIRTLSRSLLWLHSYWYSGRLSETLDNLVMVIFEAHFPLLRMERCSSNLQKKN